MLELLIIVPNLIAGYLTMKNNAFMANVVYSGGYLPFVYRNFVAGDEVQTLYFIILWIMSVIGVVLIKMKNHKDLEPENDFERAIVDLCRDIASMLIEKNRLYGDSYRNIRVEAGRELKNPRFPFWMHIKEKLSRYMKNRHDETEDIIKDAAGYCILECVCSRFDDTSYKYQEEQSLSSN